MNIFTGNLRDGCRTWIFLEPAIQNYFKLSKPTWLMKSLISQNLEEKNFQQQNINLEIELLNGKFETICKVVFEVKNVVS
jgi:hypothetical protein